MDQAARYLAHGQAIKDGWLSPNEARIAENYPPADGGDSPYLQQQNYSLAALAKRDATDDPFGGRPTVPAPTEHKPNAELEALSVKVAAFEVLISAMDDKQKAIEQTITSLDGAAARIDGA